MKAEMGCVAAFLGLFYLVGFGILGFGLWNARRSTQAAIWPTAPATIVQLDLQEGSDSEGGSTYQVDVRYNYTVNGVMHQGNRLAFGYASSSDLASHQEILQRLKEAKEVAVRYDPSDPSVSCLSFGLHRSIQFMLIFGAAWLAFVFTFTLLAWQTSGSDTVLLDNLSVK